MFLDSEKRKMTDITVLSPPEVKRPRKERTLEKLLDKQAEFSKSQQLEFLQEIESKRQIETDLRSKQLEEQREWEQKQVEEQRKWEEKMMKWRVEQTNNLILQLGQVFTQAISKVCQTIFTFVI